MTTARQRIMLDEPIDLLIQPVDDDDNPESVTGATFRFDPDQPRDAEGRWGSGVGGAITKPLTGQAALESAPVRLIRPPKGHHGDYTGAGIAGPSGRGGALALAEMEGVEHATTNGFLRNVGNPPPWSP